MYAYNFKLAHLILHGRAALQSARMIYKSRQKRYTTYDCVIWQEVSAWQSSSWNRSRAPWRTSSTRTPTTAIWCSRCPAAVWSQWCAALWVNCTRAKAWSAAAATRTTPPMAASSTHRSARPTCQRTWRRCTPSLPAGHCRTSGPRRRIRSSTCSVPRRLR